MTLDAMLASHDEQALIALTSKGLLRRAVKDLEAGDCKLTDRAIDRATLQVHGETVQISAKGPGAAQCTCPATGICRHILAGVLLLKAETSDEAPAGASAADEIVALDEARLIKFAGADWGPAQRLAGQSAAFQSEGASCTVLLSERDTQVTFIFGQALGDAAYKGPKSRRRLFITAAALLIRMKAGILISPDHREPDENTVDPAFCGDVQETLEQALFSTFSGSAELAAEVLFDRAISARAVAAPRLASQLRALSNGARKSAARSIEFNPTNYLEAAARCYALSRALAKNPADLSLSGALARNYRTTDPMNLWILGSRRWETKAGARGLTTYAMNTETGNWHTHVTARGAGIDLSFEPRSAYFGSLWGAGTPASLKGKTLYLTQPRISVDGQIASTLSQSASIGEAHLPGNFVAQQACSSWSTLRASISARMGRGLRRVANPVPALIRPERFGEMHFDDLAQFYHFEMIDTSGAKLMLEVGSTNDQLAPDLFAARAQIQALVVETSIRENGWSIQPVSVITQENGQFSITNLDFEPVSAERRFGNWLQQLRGKLVAFSETSSPETLRLCRLCDETAEVLVDAVSTPTLGQTVLPRLEAAGLSFLADATSRAIQSRKPSEILAAAYLVSELRAELS